MNNKKLFFILFILVFHSSFSVAQELGGTGGIGNAIGKTDLYKKNMLYSTVLMNYSQDLGSGFEARLYLGVAGVSYNFLNADNLDVFSRLNYLSAAIALRKYLFSNDRGLFIEGGAYGVWCYEDKKEFPTNQGWVKGKETFTGYNLGLMYKVGYRFIINNFSNFDIAFSVEHDFKSQYSRPSNEITFDKHVFSATYSIRILKNKK